MKTQQRYRLYTVLSALLLGLLVNSYYFIAKAGENALVLASVIQLVFFFILIISIFRLIKKIITQSEWRNRRNFGALFFVLLVLVLLSISGSIVNENTLQSKVKFRICYEGTMNTSRLLFRENNTFEKFGTGFFGITAYDHGTWTQNGDTLLMKYSGGKTRTLEEKLLLASGEIYRIEGDSLRVTRYYLGHCLGLN